MRAMQRAVWGHWAHSRGTVASWRRWTSNFGDGSIAEEGILESMLGLWVPAEGMEASSGE